MDTALEIRTLGELTISRQGESGSLLFSGKARALLVYLAIAGRACRREFVAELLWPDRSQTQSLTNLRKLLVELRQQAGPWMDITRETVALNDPVWLDAAEVGTCLAQAESAARDGTTPEMIAALESAVAIYRGDFLEGFDIESEAFEAWATLERERLRFSIIEALDRLVEEYTRQKNVHSGMDYAARLIRLDPLREKTYRLTMRLLAETGQREAALHQFAVCQQTLMAELGIAPSPKTWRCTNESALVNCPAKSRARCALHRPGGWSICPRRRRPSLAGRTRFRSCLSSLSYPTAACSRLAARAGLAKRGWRWRWPGVRPRASAMGSALSRWWASETQTPC